MTIEEMKAKGFKRYTGVIEKLIVTNEVEVWAKDFDDAEKILENAAEELSDSAFEDWERPEVQGLDEIHGEDMPFRFTGDKYHSGHLLAYLVELPKEPECRPFESVKKAMEAIKAHGRYVIKTNNMMSAFLVTEDDEDQGESRIFIDSHWYGLQELYRLFVFADDGSPCGELVEE